MSTAPVTVDPEATVAVALLVMRSAQVRHLPVVAVDRLVGVVAFDDLFWQRTQELSDPAAVVDAARQIPDPLRGAQQAPLPHG